MPILVLSMAAAAAAFCFMRKSRRARMAARWQVGDVITWPVDGGGDDGGSLRVPYARLRGYNP